MTAVINQEGKEIDGVSETDTHVFEEIMDDGIIDRAPIWSPSNPEDECTHIT